MSETLFDHDLLQPPHDYVQHHRRTSNTVHSGLTSPPVAEDTLLRYYASVTLALGSLYLPFSSVTLDSEPAVLRVLLQGASPEKHSRTHLDALLEYFSYDEDFSLRYIQQLARKRAACAQLEILHEIVWEAPLPARRHSEFHSLPRLS